ncbi:Rid family hydrolase [Aestuariibius sp. 2305UL40-4]|uniref:Rid family hydrolase n=1 Tax=Aestuariibius violaceus TaxID=3234132 RepID=UPI00345E100A
MTRRALLPPAMKDMARNWRMSPGLVSGDHVFLTGFNGCAADGTVSPDPATQIETAFASVAEVLAEAGLTLRDTVEMTSYHVGLQDHLALFREIRARHLGPHDPAHPDPAWTAIEVAGFATPGVIVELRVIARLGDEDP